jgi:hypothetical protein
VSLKKVERLKEQFALQMQCAKNAGIYDVCFLAFGSLLGYVRERGFIGHDNDMDVAFLGDEITKGQMYNYISELNKPTKIEKDLIEKYGRPVHPRGLYAYRKNHTRNHETGKFFWTTLRMHPRTDGYKCCNWFMFEHKGYMYHHKGGEAKVKGLPARYIKEIGHEVEYLGTKVHIPRYAGACLDFWYPDWDTPRSDVSKSEGRELKVKDWAKPNEWEFIN